MNRLARALLLAATLVAAVQPAPAGSSRELAPPLAIDERSWFAEVDGFLVHYIDTAPEHPELPAALFVHGWCGAASNFTRLFALMPPGLRCIAFDFPGCGLSGKPDVAYRADSMAGFIDRFRLALGLGAVDLVGHSLGGQLAVLAASASPESVRRLVLIDPAGLAGEEGALIALARPSWVPTLGLRLTSRCVIEAVMRANIFHTEEGLAEVRDAAAAYLLLRNGARAVARITSDVVGRSPVDQLVPRLRQEVLVLWGAEDRLLPVAWAERWMELLPAGSSLSVVPETGHMPMVEQPGSCADRIVSFLGH